MRAALLLTAFVAACWGGRVPPPPPSTPVPVSPPIEPVVLATAIGTSVEILSIAPDKTTTLRSVELPSSVVQLAWSGDDPIVMLDHMPLEQCEMPEDYYKTAAEYEKVHAGCAFDPAFDGVIGAITAHGFVPFPKLPESTWAKLAPPTQFEHTCTTGCWRMAFQDDGIYQGHCIAAFSADGRDICDKFVDARIAPLPAGPAHPSTRTWKKQAFVVPPSRRVTIEVTEVPDEHRQTYESPASELSCTIDRTTTTYPDRDKLDRGMEKDVEWLSTDPPRFIARHGHDGFTGWEDNVLFEGCTPSVIDDIVRGPDDIVIANGTVYQRGRVIGHADIGRFVDFAP